jgi:hypothetical protein
MKLEEGSIMTFPKRVRLTLYLFIFQRDELQEEEEEASEPQEFAFCG